MDLRKKIGHDPLIMVSSGAIIIENNKILLQLRKDMNLWALHGGSMDLGESIDETLHREVYEELNIKITEYRHFKTYSGPDFKITYPNQDVVYLVDNIFIVTKFEGDFLLQEEEVLDLCWFDFEDIPWDDLMPTNKIILKDFIKQFTE